MQCLAILFLATVWLASTLALPVQDQDISVESHRRYVVDLKKRTSEPPRRKLSMDEFTFKTMEVNSQVTEALRRNPSLRSKVAKALGLSDAQANPRVKMDDLILSPYNGRPYNAVADPKKSERSEEVKILDSEMNNALKQAGWKGNYYPELDELEDYTEDQLRRFHEKALRFGRELRRTRRNKPDFTRRFREALGLAPEGPWPEGYIPRRVYNKALRDAGYRGPLYPLNPPPPRGPGQPPSRRRGPKKSSLDVKPPQMTFLSTTMQNLGESLRKSFSPMISTPSSAGSPSEALPLLPIMGPFGSLKPIK